MVRNWIMNTWYIICYRMISTMSFNANTYINEDSWLARRYHTGYYIAITMTTSHRHASPIYYPTLGCDIQGFRAMGLSVQYWPRWFQDFPAIWLAVPFGANGAHLGICTLPEKNLLCVWNKLFLGEIKFSQGRTRPVKSLWWQIVPMQESANEWKKI